MTDRRAFAKADRVTVAHAIHCAFVPGHAYDLETFKVIRWIVRRFKMQNISQAPLVLPIGIWRVLDAIFPGDLLKSDHKSVRLLAQQLEAEKGAASSLSAIEKMLESVNATKGP